MSSDTRRKYDQDFKRNAVLLCSEPGRTVADNLGIRRDMLYRWRREYSRSDGQYVFPGNGIEALTPDQKSHHVRFKTVEEAERGIFKYIIIRGENIQPIAGKRLLTVSRNGIP